MRKVGILGGSFDPIHNGHLLLAEEIRGELGIDKILFMPTNIQPFKQDKKTASSNDRLAMLKLAIRSNENFDITTVELERNDVSYTFESLSLLQRQFGHDTELIFILGYDMFLNITKWWNAVALLKEYSFAVGVRKGASFEEVEAFAEELKAKFGTKIYLVHNRMFDISSTEVKERVKQNDSLRYLLPDSVIQYVYENKLYLE